MVSQIQVQSQVQVPEEMKETIHELKKFFSSRKVKFDVSQSELDEEGTICVSFEFEEPVKLSREPFNKLLDLLKDLEFYHANGVENLMR